MCSAPDQFVDKGGRLLSDVYESGMGYCREYASDMRYDFGWVPSRVGTNPDGWALG